MPSGIGFRDVVLLCQCIFLKGLFQEIVLGFKQVNRIGQQKSIMYKPKLLFCFTDLAKLVLDLANHVKEKLIDSLHRHFNLFTNTL